MKKLFSFLFRFSPGFVFLALIVSTLAGFLNTGLIALIHKSIAENVETPLNVLIWSFAAVCFMLLLTRIVSAVKNTNSTPSSGRPLAAARTNV